MELTTVCKTGVYIYLIFLAVFIFYFFIRTIIRTKKLYNYQKKQLLSNRLNHNYYVPVSILVVTHNDENKIENKIKELLDLDYKLYEIVIIDAASNDQTVNRIIDTFHLEKIDRPIRTQIKTEKVKEIYQTNQQKVKITLLKKKKEKLSDAINAGINLAEYPYFISINSDYHLLNDSIKKIVNPILEDDHIIMSHGISRMGYMDKKIYHFPKKVMNKANVIDKNTKETLLKKEFNDLSNDYSFTLFQKDAVVKCLGYDQEEIGQNFELVRKIKESFAIKKEECIIKYVDDAICYIEESKKGFFKKIRNLQRGLLLSNKKHKKIAFSSKSRLKAYFSKFFFTYYELYRPVIKLIAIIFMICAMFIVKIDMKVLFLFLGSYLLFYIFLSIYNFLVKLITENSKVSVGLFFQTIVIAIVQATIYKIITDLAKITALFGLKKKSN